MLMEQSRRSRVRVQLISRLVIALSAVVGVFAAPATVGQAGTGICNSDPRTLNPADFSGSPKDNPFFPLTPGTVWTYEGNGQREVVTVTRQRTTIQRVSAQAVSDIVDDVATGARIETTTDYFAADDQGMVWYLGEDTLENQTGSAAGTWRAGVDGSRAGIIMEANPRPGDSYRQEFAPTAKLGPAEDIATVDSKSATVVVRAGTFNNTLKTRDGSCIEGGFENKFYAPGVGLVLTTKGSQFLELVSKR
jgi:hypothetical protein